MYIKAEITYQSITVFKHANQADCQEMFINSAKHIQPESFMMV